MTVTTKSKAPTKTPTKATAAKAAPAKAQTAGDAMVHLTLATLSTYVHSDGQLYRAGTTYPFSAAAGAKMLAEHDGGTPYFRLVSGTTRGVSAPVVEADDAPDEATIDDGTMDTGAASQDDAGDEDAVEV